MAKTKAFVPSEVAELSPAWITTVMREAGALTEDQACVGMQLQALDGGTGFQGVTSRVALTYSPEGAGPATVIAKFPTVDPFQRGMAESMRVYEREISFYSDLAGEVPVRTPGYFGSAMDSGPSKKTVRRTLAVVERLPRAMHIKMADSPEKLSKPSKRRFALLIEDLGDVAVYDAANPPTEAQVRVMLSLLAELHAHFWGRSELTEHNATDAAGSSVPVLQSHMWDVTGFPVSVEHFQGDLSAEALELLPSLGDDFIADIARLNRPITLCHGDVRTDNWLWTDDQTTALVDWALPVMADPGFDIGYLLTACVDRSRGRAQAEELMDHYLSELRVHGVDHDRAELWESIETMARVQCVLHSFGLRYTDMTYGDKKLADYWIPSAISILTGSA